MQEMKKPIEKLEDTIDQKVIINTELHSAINRYIDLKLKYSDESNKLLLNTDFKEATGEARPTVAMKEAYIKNKLFHLHTELMVCEEYVNSLKRQLRLLDDYILLYEKMIQIEVHMGGDVK